MAAGLAAALSLPACGWFQWRELARTHVDLLDRMALDAVETYLASPADGGLEPGDIERLRYPLERAREFAVSSRRRFGAAPWVDRFDTLVTAYADLADWLDRARTQQPIADAEREQARARGTRVHDAAVQARAALEEPPG